MKLVTAVVSTVAADIAGARLCEAGYEYTRVEREQGGASLMVRVEAGAADRVCTLIAEVVRDHRRDESDLGLLMVKDVEE